MIAMVLKRMQNLICYFEHWTGISLFLSEKNRYQHRAERDWRSQFHNKKTSGENQKLFEFLR